MNLTEMQRMAMAVLDAKRSPTMNADACPNETTKRPAGCLCTWEEGDSACPAHPTCPACGCVTCECPVFTAPSLPASPSAASLPVSTVTARRIAANRAELFAGALRRLAGTLAHAAARPLTERERGILEADRVEAVGAGERLRTWIAEQSVPAGEWEVPHGEASDHLLHLYRSPLKAPALAIRQWADRWDAYAIAIDP